MGTKIVATIGPSCATSNIQESLIKAGMSVARFNFSYGKYEEFAAWTQNIRKISQSLNKNVAIMQDLQGPRIRIRNLSEPLVVKAGPEIKIGKGDEVDIEIDGWEIIPFLKIGERLLINDGMISLRIAKKEGSTILCQILESGTIKPNSSINFPDSNLHLASLSDKDKKDLQFGLKINVDFVALSFVHEAADILVLKKYMARVGSRKILPKVIAKIETDEAVKNLNEILAVVDGVMIARGDLGIELGRERIPMLQKEIIKKALLLAKPTIVATQMLASMINDPLPTRAEVSDVANAVLDGADSVMLSNETAVGAYPVEAVKEMQKIINLTRGENLGLDLADFKSEIDHLALSACELAKTIGAKNILAITKSGLTAKMVAKHRPHLPIIAITPNNEVAKELALFYNTWAFVLPKFNTADELFSKSVAFIKKQKLVNSGDKIVLIAGHPVDQPSQTNLVKVVSV
jgi:pyruvate kinase